MRRTRWCAAVRRMDRGAGALALLGAVGFVLTFASWCANAQESHSESALQLERIKQSFQKLEKRMDSAFSAARTASERREVVLSLHKEGAKIYEEAVNVAKRYADEPTAAEALAWIVAGPLDITTETRPFIELALTLLGQRYARSDILMEACRRAHFDATSRASREFYRAVFKENPKKEIRGIACLRPAESLLAEARVAHDLREPLLREGVEAALRMQGADVFERNAPEKLEREAETLLEAAFSTYGEIRFPWSPTSLGEMAAGKLFRLRHLSSGRPAPEIVGEDLDGGALRLSSY